MIYMSFFIGLILICKGGDWFVDAASKISETLGIPKYVVGATIVSFATTMPEIIVSAAAALKGHSAMAIGNAVGSVSANTGIILAISLFFLPAAICSGVVPQQPPSIFTSLFSTKGLTVLAIVAGSWSYLPKASGIPALGCALVRSEEHTSELQSRI